MRESLVSRRALLAGGAALLLPSYAAARTKLKVAIFSKHLQFLQGEELARGAAEAGFDAVDLTVRKGGHVEPANVARELPPLVGLLRAQRLDVPMITTDIADAGSPYAGEILRTASGLGIRRYRSGGFKWAEGVPLETQIEGFRKRLDGLAEMNRRHGMCAMYHTHSGVGLVGASIWDLHEILRGIDPLAVGINYDVGHATIEGGLGGWIASFRICGRHLRGIAVKDFVWAKDAKGAWRERWCPVGEGMVKLDEFFRMVAATDFDGPVQLHFEYPLGGANNGARTLTLPRAEVIGAMKKDLASTRAAMARAGL